MQQDRPIDYGGRLPRISAPRTLGQALPATLGILYVLAWVVGLLVGPASAAVGASSAQVVQGYLAQPGAATANYLLTEGLAGMALAGVAIALYQAARHRSASRSARPMLIAALVAAGTSVAQCIIGVLVVVWIAPAGAVTLAGTLIDLVNRVDGVKMLVLAVMALAALALARQPRVLPRAFAYLGAALAVTLIASGVGYLLGSGPLLQAVFVSLPLLLLWVLAVGGFLSWSDHPEGHPDRRSGSVAAPPSRSPSTEPTSQGGLP